MIDKQELIKIGEAIKNSDMKKSSKFRILMDNLSITTTMYLYENIVELCLQYNINCQILIDIGADFRESKLSEEEFRKIIYIMLI